MVLLFCYNRTDNCTEGRDISVAAREKKVNMSVVIIADQTNFLSYLHEESLGKED